MLLGPNFILQFLANEFILDPIYRCVLGDVGDVEESGSGGSSAPVVILVIRCLNSQFDVLFIRDAT